MKAKAQKVVVKEIRFGPNTDDHDFEFKLKHAKHSAQQQPNSRSEKCNKNTFSYKNIPYLCAIRTHS